MKVLLQIKVCDTEIGKWLAETLAIFRIQGQGLYNKKGSAMSEYALNPEFAITTDAALRDLFPPTHDLAIQKCQNHIDAHARSYIERSPFMCLGTQDANGKADVSPRGDPAGFVQILDPYTLAIPDRPGNNRLDSLANIVSNPSVGLLFIVPGFDDTMRVTGQANLTTDPAILSTMTVNDRVPKIAIIVKVTNVFIHCAKAFRRSRLWDAAYHQDRSELPSLMKIAMDQTQSAPIDQKVQQQLDEALEDAYQNTMY